MPRATVTVRPSCSRLDDRREPVVPNADPRFDFADEPVYRVFRLDKRGCIASAEIISADCDEQAGVIARTMPNGYGLELWERTRRVAQYPQQATVAP